MPRGTEPVSSISPVAPGEVQVARALLSVSDKTGIGEFARGLADLGIEIISTGGTARELENAGIRVRSISDLTGFPEIMDGRVKTLHPKLYAGLLAVRDNPEHLVAAQEQEVEFVDLVCVNLYPFERTAATRGVTDDEVVENIDIGGPTMIRAAAKNCAFAAPIVSPASYDAVLDELRESGRRLSPTTRESLAAEAFAYTARYDTAIARWFQEKREDFPPLMVRAFEKVLELPYGENPHQRAAYYAQVGTRTHVLSMVSQLGGKALSFNNLLDLDSARLLLSEFKVPGCVIVKHNNPCGVAVASTALEAYEKAFACDPMSAFGGVIAINRTVDKALAEALVEPVRRGHLRARLRRRRARGARDQAEHAHPRRPRAPLPEHDRAPPAPGRSAACSSRTATPTSRIAPRCRSSPSAARPRRSGRSCCSRGASVSTSARTRSSSPGTWRSVGIGAGQMSRVDSVRLALEKSQSGIEGCVMASDAYFPFADGPQLALEAGVTAVIQPGGSMRDPQVVEAIDAAGAAMVFTSRRHFRH